jgi:Fe-S cluster assembly scaffold protein SufB
VGKNIGDKELDLVAKEGTFTFHTVVRNQSFQLIDCTSTIIRKLFEPKFTRAQTKVRATMVNVLAPLSINQIREELEDAKFIFVMIDSSNHKHIKLVPILVRYFIPQQGVKMKILEFTNLSGESSTQLTEHIVRVLEEVKLIDKVVSLSADNTNANFGGAKRRGKNNVFERLRNKIK